jgi:hypothetical protein
MDREQRQRILNLAKRAYQAEQCGNIDGAKELHDELVAAVGELKKPRKKRQQKTEELFDRQETGGEDRGEDE